MNILCDNHEPTINGTSLVVYCPVCKSNDVDLSGNQPNDDERVIICDCGAVFSLNVESIIQIMDKYFEEYPIFTIVRANNVECIV